MDARLSDVSNEQLAESFCRVFSFFHKDKNMNVIGVSMLQED